VHVVELALLAENGTRVFNDNNTFAGFCYLFIAQCWTRDQAMHENQAAAKDRDKSDDGDDELMWFSHASRHVIAQNRFNQHSRFLDNLVSHMHSPAVHFSENDISKALTLPLVTHADRRGWPKR
jgi:hypothetical protein